MTVRDLIVVMEDMNRVTIQETYEAFVWEDDGAYYDLVFEEGKKYVCGVDIPEDAELQTRTSSVFTGMACEVPIRFGEKIIKAIRLELEDWKGRRREQVTQKPIMHITV